MRGTVFAMMSILLRSTVSLISPRRRTRPSISQVIPAFVSGKIVTTPLFSTSSTDACITSSSINNEGTPNALHTVVVHRNKQSLAFREGTPLVFTKSIAGTYSEVLDGSAGGLEGMLQSWSVNLFC